MHSPVVEPQEPTLHRIGGYVQRHPYQAALRLASAALALGWGPQWVGWLQNSAAEALVPTGPCYEFTHDPSDPEAAARTCVEEGRKNVQVGLVDVDGALTLENMDGMKGALEEALPILTDGTIHFQVTWLPRPSAATERQAEAVCDSTDSRDPLAAEILRESGESAYIESTLLGAVLSCNKNGGKTLGASRNHSGLIDVYGVTQDTVYSLCRITSVIHESMHALAGFRHAGAVIPDGYTEVPQVALGSRPNIDLNPVSASVFYEYGDGENTMGGCDPADTKSQYLPTLTPYQIAALQAPGRLLGERTASPVLEITDTPIKVTATGADNTALSYTFPTEQVYAVKQPVEVDGKTNLEESVVLYDSLVLMPRAEENEPLDMIEIYLANSKGASLVRILNVTIDERASGPVVLELNGKQFELTLSQAHDSMQMREIS